MMAHTLTGCAQQIGHPSRCNCLFRTGHPWPPARLIWAPSLLTLLADHAVCHPLSKDGCCRRLIPLSAPGGEKLLPACAPAWPAVLHNSTQQRMVAQLAGGTVLSVPCSCPATARPPRQLSSCQQQQRESACCGHCQTGPRHMQSMQLGTDLLSLHLCMASGDRRWRGDSVRYLAVVHWQKGCLHRKGVQTVPHVCRLWAYCCTTSPVIVAVLLMQWLLPSPGLTAAGQRGQFQRVWDL